jgi:cyclopropane fatty-acyl-phospholipid synthase-like methyltransferase
MNKYIFPGADASCPLAWDIEQLERSGWEIKEVENNGVHYSITILRWY